MQTNKFRLLLPLSIACAASATFFASAEDKATPAVKPIKALLVIGGCCHDYAQQKDVLKAGLEERANLTIDICYTPDKSTGATFTCYEKDNWADGYDVIIHDECSADVKDLTVVNRILAPHRNGVPGVNLHCAMHSYRTAPDVKKPATIGSNDSLWFDYIGIQSSSHGKQIPIEISYSPHAISTGFQSWTTIPEELYNNVRVDPGAKTIALGKQGSSEAIIAWEHEYGEMKTKVFSTTLGHHTETIADGKFLDLVARGLLWATGHLTPEGKPALGYGPDGK
jgi:type 1 glutamine amidotransferase